MHLKRLSETVLRDKRAHVLEERAEEGGSQH